MAVRFVCGVTKLTSTHSFQHYTPHRHKLPTALKLPETVAEQCSKGQEFTVELDDAPAKEYNGAMLDLTKKLRGLHTHKSFPALMLAFFMVQTRGSSKPYPSLTHPLTHPRPTAKAGSGVHGMEG